MSSHNNHQTPKPNRLAVVLPSAKCSKCGLRACCSAVDGGELLCLDCRNEKEKTLAVIKRLAAREPGTVVCVWMFPEEDFEAWQEMIAEGWGIEAAKLEYPSYASYRELIESHRKYMHSSEIDTALVSFTVADMKAALAKEGLANTGENRARITWEKATGASTVRENG